MSAADEVYDRLHGVDGHTQGIDGARPKCDHCTQPGTSLIGESNEIVVCWNHVPTELGDSAERAQYVERLSTERDEYRASAIYMSQLAFQADERAAQAEAECERLRGDMATGSRSAAYALKARAEAAETQLSRLKAAADKVGHQAACPVDPCDCWMRDLAPFLAECASCACGMDGDGQCPCGCDEPTGGGVHWDLVAETVQGSGADAWAVSVFQERGCDHQWLDRPESDTRVCDICGAEC